MSIKIAFIGAGRMASAIVHSLIEQKHFAPAEIACTCGDDPSGPSLANATGIQYFPDITNALDETETVLLACKPQELGRIDPGLAEAAGGKLIISILAGIPIAQLHDTFVKARNIVRTMPNTPGQIGAGVSAFAPLRELSEKDQNIVEITLSSLGNYHEVEESDLDAVTALSGSGPAYVFEFAAALRDAGAEAGLPPELAESLSVDTLLGAAMLLAESGKPAEDLRNAVTSPGGTTAAALEILEEAGFRRIIRRAVAAAKARSIALAQK
jgi:pyrroline-5-carboxylate reductase